MRGAIFDVYKFGIQVVISISAASSAITLILAVGLMRYPYVNRKVHEEHEL
jgi:hypothetical protein